MKKASLILFFLFLAPSLGFSDASPQWPQVTDPELIQIWLEQASHLTGLPAISLSQAPPIFQVSKQDLNQEVCPEDPQNCRNLAAVFDDLHYRVLILADFDLSQNFQPYDESFIIHELIHALQYHRRGPEIFHGCQAIYETEKQAYTAQDLYLKKQGDFHRVGGFFERSFYCDETLAARDYEKSKKAWDDRHQFSAVWLIPRTEAFPYPCALAECPGLWGDSDCVEHNGWSAKLALPHLICPSKRAHFL